MTELENRIENVISTYIQEYQGLVFSQIYQDIVALTIYNIQEIQSQTGLSGLIDYFDENEMHAGTRAANPGNVYEVTTVSLNDLLDQHSAPSWID